MNLNNDIRSILDFKACVMHSMYSGTDPDYVNVGGRKIPTVGYAIAQMFDVYIKPILETSRLNNIIVVKDAGSEYRKLLFDGYKVKRGKDKDPVIKQMENDALAAVEKFVLALGIPIVHCEGLEGDDIIAYLCKKLNGIKHVYTVDHDLLQLSSDDVKVFIKNNIVLNGYPVYSGSGASKTLLMELHPRHVALYKSIVGDTSDEYGGVKGLGPSAFVEMVKAFGLDGMDELIYVVEEQDFEGVLKQAIAESGDKRLVALYESRSQWRLSWLLANLHPQLVGGKRNGKFNRLVWNKRVPLKENLAALLDFHKLSYRLPDFEDITATQTLITGDTLARNPDLLYRIAGQIEQSPMVAIDWETSDELQNENFVKASNGREFVEMIGTSITGAGFTFGANLQHTIYCSFDHINTNNLSRDFLIQLMGQIPSHVPKVIQNLYFESNVLQATLGVKVTNAWDTKVMASYVDENIPNGLKESSRTYLRYKQTEYRDVVEKGMRMKDYSAQHVFKYGADDPLVTAHLCDLYHLMMEIEGIWDFCIENEFAVIEQLSESFLDGVTVDWEEMDRQKQEDEASFAKNMSRLRELISENQTPERLESGVNRVVEEKWPEVLAKAKEARTKMIKAVTEAAEGKDKVAAVKKLVKAVSEATGRSLGEVFSLDWAWNGEDEQGLFERLTVSTIGKVKYMPYEEQIVPLKFELTAVQVLPLFEKLGMPMTHAVSVKMLAEYSRDHYKALTPEAQDFLDLLVAAAPYAAPAKRDHPSYQQFKQYCIDNLLESKTTYTGSELSLSSPPQMQVLLYGILDLPVRIRQFELSDTQKTLGLQVTNAQANNDAVVTALAEDTVKGDWKHEALTCLKEAKSCQTRITMFYTPYPLWRHPYDDQIHPQINSCGTETRRPSGSSPNPLQWPKRGDGVKFRRCILPNKKLGHNLVVSIDWSQQELRVAGALSMDEVLLDCYIGSDVAHVITGYVRGLLGEERYLRLVATPTKDVHTQTASGMMKKSYEEVIELLANEDKEAKSYRNKAKPVNFGGTYDIGKTKLARQLICPADEAKKYLADKKDQYFMFERFREAAIQLARKQGFVTTQWGNLRHVFDEIVSKNDKDRSHVERSLVNYLIQGCYQGHVKVQTDQGMVPIKDLEGKVCRVWTGFKWADAIGLGRGKAKSVKVTLSSGLVIDCDDRHKVKGGDREWVVVTELKKGDLVALPSANSTLTRDYTVNWPFVLGFWLGDGCVRSYDRLDKRRGHIKPHYITEIFGGEGKRKQIEEMVEFLNSEGVPVKVKIVDRSREGKRPMYLVYSAKKEVYDLFISLGATEEGSKDKTIPDCVWGMTEADRVSFMQGYAMSDGDRGSPNVSWHSPNTALLRQVQLLLSSVGVDSNMLDTKFGSKLQSYGPRGRKYPESVLSKDTEELAPPTTARGACEEIVERRVILGALPCQQNVAERIYRKYLPDREVYRFDEVVSVEVSDELVDTFTMSVDDELHQYVAGGVISQNCAADNLKKVIREIRQEGIVTRTKASLIAPIYDELAFSVHSDCAVDLIMSVHEIMVKDIPGLAVPMLAEPSLGINFGDQIEIGRFPNPGLIEAAMDEAFNGREPGLLYHPESDTYVMARSQVDLVNHLQGDPLLVYVSGVANHEAEFDRRRKAA